MNINIRMTKNFTTQLNKLLNDYGEEFAQLNGFADNQLSYTDFISNFIDTETVADASIDGNANVANKDMRTLMNEMPKPHRKLLSFHKIYYELNKKYGFKIANEWLRAEYTKALYMHDSDTSTFLHYCYKPEESITIDYQGEIRNISFANLYELIKEPEEYDTSIANMVKRPKGLKVLDVVEDKMTPTWTNITRIVKHNNDKPMRFIKCANGISQIVTEDHPIITSEGDIPAKDVTTEHMVFTIQPDFFDGTIKEPFFNKEIGWLVGMALAEGYVQKSSVSLKQNDGPQFDRLMSILEKYEIPYTLDLNNVITLRVSPIQKYLQCILEGTTAVNKQLPSDYIHYPSEFLDGIVAGLIDGDGTIDGYKVRHCQIRIASELLCRQISNYLQTKNVFCGDRTPHIYRPKKSFTQRLPLYGIGFTLTNEEYFLSIDCIKIKTQYTPLIRKGNFANKRYQYQYGWVNVIENSEYIKSCKEVYDITTESGHFICNGILSHNCFAYDLKDLAEKGLFFLDNFNAEPPKHLSTFVQLVKEYISFTSNRSSGAVGLPNLIPYMYYFWKKIVKLDIILSHLIIMQDKKYNILFIQ